jgi:hypothetical protein
MVINEKFNYNVNMFNGILNYIISSKSTGIKERWTDDCLYGGNGLLLWEWVVYKSEFFSLSDVPVSITIYKFINCTVLGSLLQQHKMD